MKRLLTNHSAYLLKPGHDQLFQEAREWRSDLDFFQVEIAFLKKILDKALLRITKYEEELELEKYRKKISSINENSLSPLLYNVLSHEDFLASTEENTFPKTEEKIWEDHSKLKSEILKAIDDMKVLKKDIFKVVEKKIRRAKKATSAYMEGSIVL